MELQSPCIITPRLLAGLQIDDATTLIDAPKRSAFISIEPANRTDYRGALCWRYYIDLPDGTEHSDDTLAGHGSTQEMLATLLSFLTACAESYRYKMARPESEPENLSLFPPAVAEWAYIHSEELAILELELTETPDLIS